MLVSIPSSGRPGHHQHQPVQRLRGRPRHRHGRRRHGFRLKRSGEWETVRTEFAGPPLMELQLKLAGRARARTSTACNFSELSAHLLAVERLIDFIKSDGHDFELID